MGLKDFISSGKKFIVSTVEGIIDTQWKAGGSFTEAEEFTNLIMGNLEYFRKVYETDEKFRSAF